MLRRSARRFAGSALLGLVLATTTAVVTAPTPAHATSLAPLSIEQLTDAHTGAKQQQYQRTISAVINYRKQLV